MAGGPVIAVAALGVGVNVAAAWVLAKANRSSLNIEGAFQHIIRCGGRGSRARGRSRAGAQGWTVTSDSQALSAHVVVGDYSYFLDGFYAAAREAREIFGNGPQDA